MSIINNKFMRILLLFLLIMIRSYRGEYMKPEKENILMVLKTISPVLLEKYGVTKIGIFGSVARDQAGESSDVDIVYEMIKPNGFTAVHLKEDLEKKLAYPVDLVRYRERMNPLLKKRIDDEGVYV